MGTSRDIAIGPVAVVSLLLPSMVQKLVDPGADPISYRNLILTVTFFAGIFQASFGFFRWGLIIMFKKLVHMLVQFLLLHSLVNCHVFFFLITLQIGISRRFPLARCDRRVHGGGSHNHRPSTAERTTWNLSLHKQNRCHLCSQSCLEFSSPLSCIVVISLPVSLSLLLLFSRQHFLIFLVIF